jgi:hypothetical protein
MATGVDFASIPIDPRPRDRVELTTGGIAADPAQAQAVATQVPDDDWLIFSLASSGGESDAHGISTPWQPAKRPDGGAALPPRGGSGSGMQAATLALVRGQITPLLLPPPPVAASGSGAGAAALLAAVASAGSNNAGPAQAGALAGSPSGSSDLKFRIPHSVVPGQPGQGPPAPVPLDGSGGAGPPGSSPVLSPGNGSGPTVGGFPYFPLYVLDNSQGVVLFPGVLQQEAVGGWVDLEAQVRNTTVSSYNWSISGGAQHVSGTTTYQLTFQWARHYQAETDTVTLSVTDTSNHIETYTYDFAVPAGFVGSGGGTKSEHDNRGHSDQDNRWSVARQTIGRSTGGLFSVGLSDEVVWRQCRVALSHQRRIQGTSRPSLWHRSMAA